MMSKKSRVGGPKIISDSRADSALFLQGFTPDANVRTWNGKHELEPGSEQGVSLVQSYAGRIRLTPLAPMPSK